MRLRTFLIVFNAIIHLLVIGASITMIFIGYEFYKMVIMMILGSIINLFVGITIQNQVTDGINMPQKNIFKPNKNEEKINL